MVNLLKIKQLVCSKKILVAGDYLLDAYTVGKAHRISPEAPVPVIKVEESKELPGGAGNVVWNLQALGGSSIVLGRVGVDSVGKRLHALLPGSQFYQQSGYPTPCKHRIIADHQQVVRVDTETITPLSQPLEQKIIKDLPDLLEGVSVVAVSDYGKGFLSDNLLRALIGVSRSQGIPVIVDPKGGDFTKYKGCHFIKPNRLELIGATPLSSEAPLKEHAAFLLDQTEADYVIVTLADCGIAVMDSHGQWQVFPTHKREVVDVTGAGDTVLATLVLAIANKLSISDALVLSNIAASIVVEKLGCAQIEFKDLLLRAIEEHKQDKLLTQEEANSLVHVLEPQTYKIFDIEGAQSLPHLTQLIAQLHETMVGVRVPKKAGMAKLCAQMSSIDFVIEV